MYTTTIVSDQFRCGFPIGRHGFLNRSHGVTDKVGAGHVFAQIGDVEIGIEHEHSTGHGVDYAWDDTINSIRSRGYGLTRAAIHRVGITLVISRTEALDDPVNLLRLGLEV